MGVEDERRRPGAGASLDEIILEEVRGVRGETKELRREHGSLRDAVGGISERLARVEASQVDPVRLDDRLDSLSDELGRLSRVHSDHKDLTGKVRTHGERLAKLERVEAEREGAVKAGKAAISAAKIVGGVLVGTGLGAALVSAIQALFGGG